MKNKSKYFIYFLFISLSLSVLATGCSKKVFTTSVIQKDSTVWVVDTIYNEINIDVPIMGDTANASNELFISIKEFNCYIDSLFANIDTTARPPTETITNRLRGLWNSDTSHLETQLAYSDAYVKSGYLSHTLVQKDTSLQFKYDSLQMLITSERETWHNKETTATTTITPKQGFWARFGQSITNGLAIIGALSVLAIAAWVAIKIFKPL